MHKALLVLAMLALTVAPQAQAAPLFFDDFSQEALALNTTLDKWTVSDGTVDVIGTGFHQYCGGVNAPSPDRCLDLDGSTGNAGRITSHNLLLDAGTYNFSFWLKGNSRNQTNDTVRVAVAVGHWSDSITLNGLDPWQQFSGSFTLAAPETVNLIFDHSGGDNIGILLDNVSLVPEPTLLGLLGLGLAGAFVRRRRA